MLAEARQQVVSSLRSENPSPSGSLDNQELPSESIEGEPPPLVFVEPAASSADQPQNPEPSNATIASLRASFGNTDVSPVLLQRDPIPARPRFRPLQMFEGTVLQLCKGEFVARLRNTTDPGEPDHRATISLEEVWDSDHKLIEPGAIFYWSIGYTTEPTGQRSVTSTIRFRRLPAWTGAEIEKIEIEAAQYDSFFDDED